jgi:hypothetical protein
VIKAFSCTTDESTSPTPVEYAAAAARSLINQSTRCDGVISPYTQSCSTRCVADCKLSIYHCLQGPYAVSVAVCFQHAAVISSSAKCCLVVVAVTCAPCFTNCSVTCHFGCDPCFSDCGHELAEFLSTCLRHGSKSCLMLSAIALESLYKQPNSLCLYLF